MSERQEDENLRSKDSVVEGKQKINLDLDIVPVDDPGYARTQKDDLDGISNAEKARRDKILSDYTNAIEEAARDEKLNSPVNVKVIGVRTIIGRGHHSNVYGAELSGSRSPVVLKVDYRNLIDNYPHVWEKVKALRKIENPHIQRLIDFVPDWKKKRSYLIYDYIPGDTLQKTLYDRMQEGGEPFPQGRVLNWAVQLLDAVQYLHTKRLVHGDINLSNIILRPKKVKPGQSMEEHDICLIDFNWGAPDMEAGDTRQDIPPKPPLDGESAQTGGMIAKAENKEAFRRGIRRDIYHVGAVMYQLLTGEVPNTDKGRIELVEEEKATGEKEKREKLKLNHVTDDVADVILKAISVEPNDRYSSAQKMLNALTELPYKSSDTDSLVKPFRIRQWAIGACAVLGVLIVVLGFWQVFRLSDMATAVKEAIHLQEAGDYTEALRQALKASGGGFLNPPASEKAREALIDILGLTQSGGKYRPWASLPMDNLYPVRVRLSRDEKWLVVLTGENQGETSRIIAKSMESEEELTLPAVSSLDDFAFTNNHTILYSNENRLICYDLNSNRQEWTLEPPIGEDAPAAMAVSGDMAKTAVIYPNSAEVYIYNTIQSTEYAEPQKTVPLDAAIQDIPGRMFLLDESGNTLAVSLSGADVGVYDISGETPERINGVTLTETDNGYTHYQGGFYDSWFLLTASMTFDDDGETSGERHRFLLDRTIHSAIDDYHLEFSDDEPYHVRTDMNGMFLAVGNRYFHVTENQGRWGTATDMGGEILLLDHAPIEGGGRILAGTPYKVTAADDNGGKLAELAPPSEEKPWDLGVISPEWLVLTGTNHQMLSILRWTVDGQEGMSVGAYADMNQLRNNAEMRWKELSAWDGRHEA